MMKKLLLLLCFFAPTFTHAATFVSDTFTDTDGTLLTSHTGAIGATWTQHPSSGNMFWIQGNKAQPRFSNFIFDYASGLPATAEYDVSATVTVVGTDFSVAGLTARMDTSSENYYLAYAVSNTGWKMFEVIGGVQTQIGSTALQTFNVNDVYSVKFEVRDASKTLYVNGVAVITDTTHNNITAAGRAGVYGFSANGGGDLNVLGLSNYTAVDAGAAPASTAKRLTLRGVRLILRGILLRLR